MSEKWQVQGGLKRGTDMKKWKTRRRARHLRGHEEHLAGGGTLRLLRNTQPPMRGILPLWSLTVDLLNDWRLLHGIKKPLIQTATVEYVYICSILWEFGPRSVKWNFHWEAKYGRLDDWGLNTRAKGFESWNQIPYTLKDLVASA